MSINKEEEIVVVGAGLMGTGIAHGFASSGYPTVLVDTNADSLSRARDSIGKILRDGVALGKVTADLAESSMARLTVSSDLGKAAQGANWLVETVSERLEVKKAVVAQAEPLLAPDAIVATNTSALSVTEIAASLAAPERDIGMHFFTPVHQMKVVALLRGPASSEEVVVRE